MKSCPPAVQNCHLHCRLSAQSGYTLIELMIAIAIIGILVATAVVSYQTQLRQTQILTIYQELNLFRLPYQTLVNEGAGVTGFNPSGLNIPVETKYCLFSVTAPLISSDTPNAITCTIQNLSFLQGQMIHLDYIDNGKWQCRVSAGIKDNYLPKACQ